MKKLTALLLVLVMTLGFAACGGDGGESTTAAPEETTAPVEATLAPEETTAAPEETTLAQPVSELVSDPTVAATENTTAVAAAKAPETKAEIINLYNSAIASAYDAKAGFNKKRYVDDEQMDMSLALKAFKGLVEKFVGIGAENVYTEDVTKGNWDKDPNRAYLRKSTLTEADVTEAECKQEGNTYIVSLDIKGGSSKGSQNSKYTNAPVDKCGICVGNTDKGYYDHKSGEVIYDAIAGTYKSAKIDESYNDAEAVAKIDAATGKLLSLTVTYDISVAIDIGIGSGTATGESHIEYNNVKY